MNSFFFDASALTKRYATEPGAELVDHILDRVGTERRMCLLIGAGEVASVLVRRRNERSLTGGAFQHAWDELLREVADSPDFATVGFTDADVRAAFPLLLQHGVNITDAVLLRVLMGIRALAVASGDDVIPVASDQRLLRAATAEGISTFDPERQSQAELDALLNP